MEAARLALTAFADIVIAYLAYGHDVYASVTEAANSAN